MKVEFINPEGRRNTAEINKDKLELLKGLSGYKVMNDPFADETPAVSTLKVHKAAGEDSVCVSCEG